MASSPPPSAPTSGDTSPRDDDATRRALVNHHHLANMYHVDSPKSKSKGFFSAFAGERLTPERRAAQHAEFEKARRRAFEKEGKSLPAADERLESETASLIGLIMRFGKTFHAAGKEAILITFGELQEHYDDDPPVATSLHRRGWALSCAELLLHAATHAKLKYSKSVPGSDSIPRLTPGADDQVVIEFHLVGDAKSSARFHL